MVTNVYSISTCKSKSPLISVDRGGGGDFQNVCVCVGGGWHLKRGSYKGKSQNRIKPFFKTFGILYPYIVITLSGMISTSVFLYTCIIQDIV